MPEINKILISKFSSKFKVSYKPSGYLSTSIVTEVDRQIEKILTKKLTKILPGSGFIGEETKAQVNEYNWIVDPIDGTLNFASHIPNFAVSIALWHHNQPVYAITNFPLFQETVHALSGKGIFLNNRSFIPANHHRQKLFLTYSIVAPVAQTTKILDKILKFTSSPRSFGSCVFHGANIALGRIDAGVFINQAIWDIAAIALLAQEAGLTCRYVSNPPDLVKDNLKLYQYSLILGPEALIQKLTIKL